MDQISSRSYPREEPPGGPAVHQTAIRSTSTNTSHSGGGPTRSRSASPATGSLAYGPSSGPPRGNPYRRETSPSTRASPPLPPPLAQVVPHVPPHHPPHQLQLQALSHQPSPSTQLRSPLWVGKIAFPGWGVSRYKWTVVGGEHPSFRVNHQFFDTGDVPISLRTIQTRHSKSIFKMYFEFERFEFEGAIDVERGQADGVIRPRSHSDVAPMDIDCARGWFWLDAVDGEGRPSAPPLPLSQHPQRNVGKINWDSVGWTLGPSSSAAWNGGNPAVIVVGVAPGGVAEQIGVQVGAFCVSMNGRRLQHLTDLCDGFTRAMDGYQVVFEIRQLANSEEAPHPPHHPATHPHPTHLHLHNHPSRSLPTAPVQEFEFWVNVSTADRLTWPE